jgi:hypothetical protein
MVLYKLSGCNRSARAFNDDAVDDLEDGARFDLLRATQTLITGISFWFHFRFQNPYWFLNNRGILGTRNLVNHGEMASEQPLMSPPL